MKIKEEREREVTLERWGNSVSLPAEAEESLRQAASVLLLRPWCLCKVHVTHGASLQGQTRSSQLTFPCTNIAVTLQRGASSGRVIRLGSELPDVDSNERGKKALKKTELICAEWQMEGHLPAIQFRFKDLFYLCL